MARKTAMKKDPKVSVALPASEKRRLGMSTTPSDKPLPQRLSPGVYRGPKGNLQTESGKTIPRQPGSAKPPGQLANAMGAGQAISGARPSFGQKPMPIQPDQNMGQQIATRPPAPLGTPPGVGMQQAAEQGQQAPLSFGDMMAKPPQMGQQMQRYPEQQQSSNFMSGFLQQGGQQQQPMMQDPQMRMQMPPQDGQQYGQKQPLNGFPIAPVESMSQPNMDGQQQGQLMQQRSTMPQEAFNQFKGQNKPQPFAAPQYQKPNFRRFSPNS